MTQTPDTGRIVVAHFRDGRILKGTTQDFGPQKPLFHLFLDGNAGGAPLTVPIGSLKAAFFVKTPDGDPSRQDAYDFDSTPGQGRRVRVTFEDGEIVDGFTMGYAKDKQGFFVIPADAGSNNARIFVVAAATDKVEFLPIAGTAARPA
jgi:hypothetical protein